MKIIAQPLALPYFHIVTPLSHASLSPLSRLYDIVVCTTCHITVCITWDTIICDVYSNRTYSNRASTLLRGKYGPPQAMVIRGCALFPSSEFEIQIDVTGPTLSPCRSWRRWWLQLYLCIHFRSLMYVSISTLVSSSHL